MTPPDGEHSPLTESQVRHIVTEVFSEYIYRLDARYVKMAEFADVKSSGTRNSAAITILEERLKGLDDRLLGLSNTISRVGWAVVLTVLAAVIASVLRPGLM